MKILLCSVISSFIASSLKCYRQMDKGDDTELKTCHRRSKSCAVYRYKYILSNETREREQRGCSVLEAKVCDGCKTLNAIRKKSYGDTFHMINCQVRNSCYR